MGKKKRKKAKSASRDYNTLTTIWAPDYSEVWYGGWADVLNMAIDRKTVEIGGAEFVVINAGENEDLT
ncbi:hypothetical protein [Alteraurantiacibacter buctensis]|uniref:Uncharacterized protein n=1 Tax=Alteraurantiacibacter buctensis TaxID=1503981 RepID=A0A844Z1L5_9SPHN|nr:hypothetical protein [Alteraurantiacibacter buctensis]MXO72881.1 hypothetical protein [Alteraurantiacibacter buctensis]